MKKKDYRACVVAPIVVGFTNYRLMGIERDTQNVKSSIIIKLAPNFFLLKKKT